MTCFTSHLNKYMTMNYHGLNPSRLFNFIPKPSPYYKTWRNIWLHNEIPTTHIITGVNIYTGHPIAIKELHNEDLVGRRRQIIDRLQIALHYKDTQDKGILGICDIWCTHQMASRLSYFHQTLLGLAELHEQGIVHGNIRPESLIILANAKRTRHTDFKAPAIKRAVLSFSMSQVWKKMLDTTRVCIAPEVWRKRTRTTMDLDETKLDI
ncbi:hypothetical protein V8C34DRAFT_267889 [Trichoderma compactum]